MAQNRNSMSSQLGAVPNPDPTVRTVEQMQRDLGATREILENKIDGGHNLLIGRLSEMDKAILLVQRSTDSIPQLVKNSVEKLESLHGEKINGRFDLLIEKITSLANVTTQQFKSIEDRFVEKDKAVTVGLTSQKESAAAEKASSSEATMKMESNFTTLLNQGREMLAEVRKSTDQQMAGLKDLIVLLSSRLDKGEGRTIATTEVHKDTRDNMGLLVALVVAAVAIAALYLKH